MSAPAVSDPLGGQLYGGRYALGRKVARGGMATVFEGIDNRLGRVVAIKLMHEGLGDDVDFAAKFDKEARAAARLSHPNIVAVFDQGVEADRPYIVMEYVQGCTLRALIRREGRLSPASALNYLEPVVRALAVAHDVGLVHCDVKPENVLISEQGVVKVTDFGLAKAVTGQTNTATQGMLIGTVSYISPERVTTNKATSRSDVYSVGVMLYELLTGQKPHRGDSPIQIAYSHVHHDIPAPSTALTRGRRTIPPYLDALVLACTRRDPSQRPADGRALARRVALARRALAQHITDDPELTQRLGAGPEADLADPPSAGSPASPQTGTMPAVQVGQAPTTPATAPSDRTWTLRSPGTSRSSSAARDQAATPVSPVDLETKADAMPDRPARSSDQVKRRDTRPMVRQLVRISQSKVHRRRRGMVALVLLLMLTLIGGGVSYSYLSEARWTTTPNLVGMSEPEARSATEAALLGFTATQEYSETVAAGRVVRTDPAAGASIRRDGQITAAVSLGPERFDAPELVGTTRDRAEAALARNNLGLGEVTETYHDSVAAGVVIKASVPKGTKLKRGDRVDLVVSKGPQPIQIPNYVGKSVQQAQQELQAAGFTVTITQQHSKTVAEGLVISQSPPNGEGKKGDRVTLTASQGPVVVTVPTVRGMPKDQAVTTLKTAGFDVATKTIVNGPTAAGIAYGTDPAAGAKVPEGSTITVLIG